MLKAAGSLSVIFFCSFGFAQSRAPQLLGGIGVGTTQFNGISPTSNQIKFNNGILISLAGQKALGFLNSALTGSLDYYKTNGSLNYNYTSPTNITYVANMVNFGYDSFRASLGLRFKIMENSWIRPYLEGGGSAGYTQFSYDSGLKAAVSGLGNDYKMSDSTLDFAEYLQLGFEVDLSHTWGLEIASRWAHQVTRPIDTLTRQVLTYEDLSYFGTVFFRF